MRYNDWENDPLSNDDPAESILSRYDLRPASCLHSGTTISVLIQIMRTGTMTMCPAAFAGLDSKTTNYALATKMKFDAISSPQVCTKVPSFFPLAQYETQPVWVFGVSPWEDVMWDGLPQVWDFPWVQFIPDSE